MSSIELEMPLAPAGALSRSRSREALHRMITEGKSSREIAGTLGITQRTLVRNRRRLREGDDWR